MPNHFPVGRTLGAVAVTLIFAFPMLLARPQAPDNKMAIKASPPASRTSSGSIASTVNRSVSSLRPITIYYRSYAPKSTNVTAPPTSQKPGGLDLSPVIISYRIYSGKPATASVGPAKAPPPMERAGSGNVSPVSSPVARADVDTAPITAQLLAATQSPTETTTRPVPSPTPPSADPTPDAPATGVNDSSTEAATQAEISRTVDVSVPPHASPPPTGTSSEPIAADEPASEPPPPAPALAEDPVPPPSSVQANIVAGDSPATGIVGSATATELAGAPPGAIEMNNSAVQLTGQSRYEEATDLLLKAIAQSPDVYKFHRNLSIVYEHQRRFDEALISAQRAVELAPHVPAAVAQLCGVKLLMARDAEAADCYKELSELTPLDTLMQTSYGVVLLRTGKYQDAIPILEKAATDAPTTAALNALGVAYFYVKRFADSLIAFKNAVELDPERCELRYNLGIAQLANHNKEGALSQYRMLKDEDPKLAEQLYDVIFSDKVVSIEQLRH